MEIKIERNVFVDYIEVRFMNDKEVEIEYIDVDGETIKIQHANTLEEGLELIKGENK